MKKYAERFYKSKQWQDARATYLAMVGGLCERCAKKGKIVPAEIVHHKIYISPGNINDPSITLDFKNFEALCRDCHAEEHFGSSVRYRVDEFGRVSAK
mgnify:CR=1 FL=1